jgi:hypothetical protein
MARKRAPGGGRKPRGEYAGLSTTLSLRMPADMRAQLERSAAKRRSGKGWSLTQEILRRLQRSLERERDERRDPPSRAICYLLAEVISAVASNTVGPNWRSDPWSFRAIKLAFGQVLDALEPTGKIRAPVTRQGDPFSGLWAAGAIPVRFQLGGGTPEEMAHFVRDVILMRMRQDAYEEPPGAISLTPTQEEFEFGMSDAVRDLKLREPNQ